MAYKVKVQDPKRFLKLIISKGFSVRKLAREAGLANTTIQLMATGDRSGCSPATAAKILNVLGAEFNDVFFIEDADKSNQEQAAASF